jgi:hypothetical protein
VVEAPLLSDDPSGVVERRKNGDVLTDRNAAAAAAFNHLPYDEEPIAEVDQVLRLDPKRTPGAAPIGVKLAVAIAAAVNRRKPEHTLLAVSYWSYELHIGS